MSGIVRMSGATHKTKAIFFIVLSAFCFNLMNIFVRMAGDIPSMQKSFFRNLIAAVAAAYMIWKDGQGFHPKRENIPLLIARSFFGTIGILCNFYAVDHLLLSNASMLQKMAPFMVPIFSFLILKERLKPAQLGMILTAFVGCIFIVKPSVTDLSHADSLIGLMGGVAGGLAYTLVRKASLAGENGAVIVLFFSAFSCLAVLPWVALHYCPMSWFQVAMLLGAGAAAAAAQFSVTAAYSNAPSKEISIYDYSQVLWAAISGFVLFGDVPDRWSVVGYGIIIAAVVGMFFYNSREES